MKTELLTPHEALLHQTRRHFLRDCTTGLGALWFATTTGRSWAGASVARKDPARPLLPTNRPLKARARRVIYLHMAGSPSQLELFDYKPDLSRQDGKDCPASFLKGRQFAFIQGVPKMLGPQYAFKQHGQSG